MSGHVDDRTTDTPSGDIGFPSIDTEPQAQGAAVIEVGPAPRGRGSHRYGTQAPIPAIHELAPAGRVLDHVCVPREISAQRSAGPKLRLGGALVFAVAAVGGGAWLALDDHAPSNEDGPAFAEAGLTPVTSVPSAAKRCPAGMVFVEGGKFFMGTDKLAPLFSESRPARKVEVHDFCIAKRETSLAEYRACSSAGACKRAYRASLWPQATEDLEAWNRAREVHSVLCNENDDARAEHPVNCVSWNQAVRYCAWRGWRLPTEVEWEFAARGSDGRTYPWGDEAPSSERLNACGAECRAWRVRVAVPRGGMLYEDDDGFPGTSPVGSFTEGKSRHGLLDMAGNVFEWTSDPFIPRQGPRESEPRRVIRGGAFNGAVREFANPALRLGQVESAHVHAIGFRCAANPLEEV